MLRLKTFSRCSLVGRCVAAMITLATTAYGQQGLFQCNASLPAGTPTVRSEGLTELGADILLQCKGGTPTPFGQPVPGVNITVTMNGPLANTILIPGSSFTDAVLLIDEPAPANQIVAPATAASAVSFPVVFGGIPTVNFLSGAIPNMALGTQLNATTVQWLNIPIDPPAIGATRFVRIAGLKVAGPSFTPDPSGRTPVVASVQISGGRSIPVVPSSLTAGVLQPGLITSITSAAKPHCASLYPTLSSSSVPINTLRFAEGFSTAFKPKAAGPQNMPGKVYNTEGSFTVPGYSPQGGPGQYGTRLRAAFSNIPAGVNVFVSTNPVSGTTGTAQMIDGGAPSGSTGLSQIVVTGSTGSATWEVMTSDPTVLESFAVPVFFSFASNGTLAGSPAAPSQVQVMTSFDPSTGTFAPQFPFRSPQAPLLFSLNSCTGETPVLSMTMDPRECTLFQDGSNSFPYAGNACAGGDGPHLTIFSDSGPLSPLLGFTPASGGPGGSFLAQARGEEPGSLAGEPQLGSGPVSGSTPVNALIAVNLQNAGAGTYQSKIAVTAPGSGNSLSLPFTTTVLAANNPVILPLGFDDAGNFQSGSVAPGQIFTLFGKNFGPANGLVQNPMDAAGRFGTTVAGLQVLFDGVAAPLLFTVGGQYPQVAGIAPFGLQGKTSTNVQLVAGNLRSPVIALPVNASNISVLSGNGSGGGPGAITNSDGKLNTALNPASRGEIVVIYASYAGPLTVPGTDGRTTTGAPYPAPTGPLSIMIGGVPATDIRYFGNVPTLLESVLQINVTVPAAVKPGSFVPVVVSAGGATSTPWTTMAVK